MEEEGKWQRIRKKIRRRRGKARETRRRIKMKKSLMRDGWYTV